MRNPSLLGGLGLMAIVISAGAGQNDDRWWPVQGLPKTVIRTASQQEFPAPRIANQMMVQSNAGLAAKAVNEGQNDELVWVDNGNEDLDDWLARWLATHRNVKSAGPVGPWELVDHFAKRGIIQGYILYRLDRSHGEINAYRPGMDCSVNVATSLAGLLQDF